MFYLETGVFYQLDFKGIHTKFMHLYINCVKEKAP